MKRLWIIPAILMFWGWPGILLFVCYGFSAMTAYRGPDSKVEQFLMNIAIPNLWCLARAA